MSAEAVTREEILLAAAAGEDVTPPNPITREELFLGKMAGMDVVTPRPITRKEMFLQKVIDNGGAGGSGGTTIKNQNKTITENGQYTADSGYTGLGTVTVAVPEEDPVLQDKQITANGTYSADAGYDGLGEVVVNVPASADPVIQPLSVTQNGTYEAPDGVDGYSPVTVAIESGGGGDDGSFKAVIERTATEPTLPSDLTSIGNYAFYGCNNLALTSLPDGLTSIGGNAFRGCTKLTELTFKGKPSSISSSAFDNCTNLLTINVPWAEGEVANAPWGATNATINYNYTGG